MSNLDQQLKNSLRIDSALSPNRRRSKSENGLKKSPNSLSIPSSAEAGERRHSSGSDDRFIPNRSTTDYEYASHAVAGQSSQSSSHSSHLENDVKLDKQRILSFKSSAPEPEAFHVNSLKVLYSTSSNSAKQESKARYISNKPVKILDAPNLSNDFYIRTIDWSPDNILSVIFSSRVLLWNANDMTVDHLTEHPEGSEFTCLSWQDKYLAISDYLGAIALWNGEAKKCLRRLGGHTSRVGTMSWSNHNLASGSRSGKVLIHDVRIKNHIIHTVNEHTQEVCGIDWSVGGSMFATGGNDNMVHVWDIRSMESPIQIFTQHQSAIKAIKWCPWSNTTLATGGGTSDRSLKIWNTNTGNCMKSIDTGSQMSSVLWNSEYKELITGQGFSSNQLSIWKYPSLTKIKDLVGHTSRITCLAINPDASVVASTAGDESIRIWLVWPPKEKSKKSAKSMTTTTTTLFQKIR